jgi:hypothetical protein
MVALVAAVTVLSYGDAISFEGRSPANWFTNGVFATLLSATAGYAVAWMVWWLRRR